MEVLGVTNIGFKLNDGTIIPIIRAIMGDLENANLTVNEVNAIYEDIYNRASGASCICGFRSSDRDTVISPFDVDGSYSFGNINNDGGYLDGISVSWVTGNRVTSIFYSQTRENPDGGLYYDGQYISQILAFTSIEEGRIFGYGFGLIFTDENYNLITPVPENTPLPPLRVYSDTFLGGASYNGVCIATVGGGELYVPNTALNFNTSTGINIEDDVTEEIDPDETDPYKDGGNSGTGGGEGDFNGDSDDVDFPDLPSLSATDTGFITIFNPSIAQLQSLASYMWGTIFDPGSLKKLFADPMDCILGLSIVPVNVPSGTAKAVKVGNIATPVSMTVASHQYVEVDCGTINVNEYWGAYLDYSPYTKAEIYLPYIGTHAIDVDDIMNKAVHVKYHVDILSGACTAYVKCGDSIIYSFIGQCASSIPISGNDWTNVINGVLSISGSIGTMVASGGATAPMAMQQIASTSVNSMKPTVEKSGSMSGTGGMLGVQKPYLILTRPRQAKPANQNKYMGYPSFVTRSLGGLSGYNEIESIHLDNIPATDAEIKEIETLLKSGVIF